MILRIYIMLLLGLFATLSFGQSNKSDTTVSFEVHGVCEQCKQRIEGALQTRGVNSAVWDVDTKILTVDYNPNKTTLEKLHKKVAAVGHDTPLKKADDDVYMALPDCCHYREIDTNPGSHDELDGTTETETSVSHTAVTGVVLEEDRKGTLKPLKGASVLWLNSTSGTTSNENGIFTVAPVSETNQLVVSFAGFKADTIAVNPGSQVKIILAAGKKLNEVVVTAWRPSTFINPRDPFRTYTINQKELLKAACCNLSESFETNPSVDVSYNDAITGSKQIQLLGLAGAYTQLTVENLPGPRGLATSLGLNSIPGTWIESIQLSKGTGSVVNGYESIAGQINVELKKPETSERLYANIYENNMGRTDLNLNLSGKVSNKFSSTLLLHDNMFYNNTTDFNKDGFRDLPTGNLFSAVNRWNYENNKGLMSQFGVKYLNDNRTGGQTNFKPQTDKFTTNSYGLQIDTRRLEAFGKLGYVFPQQKYKSIGLELSAFDHRQNSYFGLTTYNAQQQNFYSNLIYQSIINNTNHRYRAGLSFVYDKYNENYKADVYNRSEVVPGAFFEYTYTASEKFDLVAGIREDYNSLYGWFTTPRLNVRYQPFTGTTIRVSAGRGQRTANIFAENNAVLASARQVQILGNGNGAYGLQPEVAWNKGISIDQKFKLFNRAANLGLDFYRNDFTNQVVVDLENARMVKFYNLAGRSYSNSLQAELSFMPMKRFDIRLAYRMFDVKTNYSGKVLQRPLTAQNRSFANFAYEAGGFKFDYTISYSGKKRLPSTEANPAGYQRPAYSPDFVTMNAQVSRSFGKNKAFDIYLGGENLTNYYQENAVVAAGDPFGNYFDASMIWGPITGRMLYAGLRFKIK